MEKKKEQKDASREHYPYPTRKRGSEKKDQPDELPRSGALRRKREIFSHVRKECKQEAKRVGRNEPGTRGERIH